MKICPHCGNRMDDSAMFCTSCGGQWIQPSAEMPGMQNQYGPDQTGYSYGADYSFPYDHTAEFTQQDIHDNKVICLAIYMLGVAGIIIAMLGSKESPFTAFHVRQALKITILEALTGIATAVLCWTIIALIAGPIFLGVLSVVRIICFVRICSGKAIEPPIVRSFAFLN